MHCKRSTAAELQRARVARWNSTVPVGTAVVVREDNGEETRTTTRSPAWLLGDHTAVVQLADRAGCFLLQRVHPEQDTEGLAS